LRRRRQGSLARARRLRLVERRGARAGGGGQRDVTSQLELDRRQMLGGLALGLGGAMLAACGSRAGAQAGADTCIATPREIKGPFPADGTNGRPRPINVLAMDGVVRRDIRSSFAGMSGRAEGVPLELELR